MMLAMTMAMTMYVDSRRANPAAEGTAMKGGELRQTKLAGRTSANVNDWPDGVNVVIAASGRESVWWPTDG